MESSAKRGNIFVFVGIVLLVLAFFTGVNTTGIILMALAISVAGYGAGVIMNTPCTMVKK